MPPGPVRSGAWSLLALAVAAAVQLPIHDRSVVALDEGQLAAIAARLAAGQVLYRDVYTGIFPGVYHAAAWLLALFGDDLVVLRRAQVGVNALTALCLWHLARRVAPGWSWLPPVLYLELVVLDFPGLSMLNYSPLSLLFALAALLALLRFLEGGRLGEALLAGLALGACALVKQNFGVLAGLALVGGMALGGRATARAIATLALGAAAPLAAAAIAFAAAGALPALVDATLLSIGASQLESFHDPLPPILGAHPDDPRFVFLYTPAALFNYLVRGERLLGLAISPALRGAAIRLAYGGALATLVAGALAAFACARDDPRRAALRAVALFAGLLFLGLFPSAIWSHLAFVAAPLLVLLAAAADRLDARLGRAHAAGARTALRALAAALALAGGLVALRISADVMRWYPEPLGIARARLRVAPEQRALLRGATAFLERCAGQGEPVFAAPDLPVLYFLTGRPNATPYDLVIPGNVDDAAIVEALERSGTRCVVYNPRMYLQFGPFEELFPELSHHLESVYRRVAELGGGDGAWVGLVRAEGAR
jgi:hypothetical protein